MHCSETPIKLSSTDLALIDAYKALGVFVCDERWSSVVAENDPTAFTQAREAIATIESALPTAILLTILPTYTRVRISINGGATTGQLRDGAWGLQARNQAVYPRRITTDRGFELWVGPDTPVDSFEVL